VCGGNIAIEGGVVLREAIIYIGTLGTLKKEHYKNKGFNPLRTSRAAKLL
tara:strand:- start:144 stop:293 length:150 start_codon:yes stop_codon:yes gene_type:complete